MKVSFDLVIFCKEHQSRLLRKEAWSLFEVGVGITEEGEVKGRVKLRRVRAMSMTIQSSVKDKILATQNETSKVRKNIVIDALRRKEQVKPRRVRAMAMTIQYGVRGMILAAQSEAFKQENALAERLHGSEMDEAHASRLRWTIYPVLLVDAAENVRDAIGFEYCLASLSGWTKVAYSMGRDWESSLTGLELVPETTDK
ncbi:hypothetical protein Tco_1331904, partial [Tanacetum coccineum]